MNYFRKVNIIQNKRFVRAFFVIFLSLLFINTSVGVFATSQEKELKTEIKPLSPSTKQEGTNSQTESGKNNLLKNGDFKLTAQKSGQWTGTQAVNWTAWVDKNVPNDTHTIAVTDSGVVELSSQQEFKAVVYQELEIDSSKKYSLSFKIKTVEKKGRAYIRIIEGEGKDKHLWLSPTVTGNGDWKQLTADYEPIPSAKKIRVELMYEKGTGSIYFSQVELIEKENNLDPELDKLQKLEDKITIPLNKKYLFNKEEYTYQIADVAIATIEKEIIKPIKAGTTKITVSKDGKLVKEIDLIINPAMKDKYTSLLEKWNDIIAGNRYLDLNNSYMAKLHQDLEANVTKNLATLKQEANRTYLWQDISDYKKSANITATYRRLEEIAKQVTNPHSKYYQDGEIIRMVRDCLIWMHQNVYNTSKSIVGNWWDYEIGAPRAINNTFSLLQEYFSWEQTKCFTEVIEKFVPDPRYFRSTLDNPFKALGGNLVDMGRVKIIAGLLRKDDKEIAATTASIENVFTYVDHGEGFYQDGSYIDHTNVAYTGAYGSVLIDGLSQLLPVIQASDFAIPDAKIALVYQWIDKSFWPLIINGELADLSRGRSISRANSEAHVAAVEVMRGVQRIAQISDDGTKKHLKTVLKTIIKADTFYNVFDNLKTYKDIHEIDQLLKDNTIPTKPRASYLSAFNNMDKLVMYNAEKGFGFALSMFSNKTKNYEDMNNENRKGWYTGDGMFYLYNNNLGHYSNNFWPTVNHYKMAGTTETDLRREDGSGQDVLPSKFVGISKLNEMNATAAMDFTNWNKTLKVHKGWVILKDKIVFLGSNIQNSSNDRVATTIDQRKEEIADPYKVYVNGKATDLSEQETKHQGTETIFLESKDPKKNIGYFFFKKTDINMLRKVQEGTWKAINNNQSEETVTNKFITITQPHQGNGDSYAYVLIPNVDRETFNKQIKDLGNSLLENNNSLQVVFDESQKVWGIIKYDDGDSIISNRFRVKKRGIYTICQDQNEYTVAYYNPETKAQASKNEVFEELVVNNHKRRKAPATGDQKNLQLLLFGIISSLGLISMKKIKSQ